MMKTYDSIVAPLKKMEKNLKAYANTQYGKKLAYVKQQIALDVKINKTADEILKADITSTKIGALLDTTNK